MGNRQRVHREGTRVGYWWGSGGLNQNMTIPRQLSLGEVIGKEKGKAQPKHRPLRLRVVPYYLAITSLLGWRHSTINSDANTARIPKLTKAPI